MILIPKSEGAITALELAPREDKRDGPPSVDASEASVKEEMGQRATISY